MLQDRGRLNEAEFFFEKALEVYPDDRAANRRFGLFLKQIGETKRARAQLKRALEVDPDDVKVLWALAELGEDDDDD